MWLNETWAEGSSCIHQEFEDSHFLAWPEASHWTARWSQPSCSDVASDWKILIQYHLQLRVFLMEHNQEFCGILTAWFLDCQQKLLFRDQIMRKMMHKIVYQKRSRPDFDLLHILIWYWVQKWVVLQIKNLVNTAKCMKNQIKPLENIIRKIMGNWNKMITYPSWAE